MSIINSSYKINNHEIIYSDDKGIVSYPNTPEVEKMLSQKVEHEYIKNRKGIILDAVDKCKQSREFFKAASLVTIYFVCTSTYNVLYVLGNPGANIYNSPLFISNIVALLGSIGLNSISKVYKDIARKTFRSVDQTDTFMKLKDEYNAEEVKSILEVSNPTLFSKIKLSKLEQPINLNIYNQMTSIDKTVTFDIASVVKDNKPVDHDVEIIDMFEVEDSLIKDAIKIKRMYTR